MSQPSDIPPPQAGSFVRHARTVAGLTLVSRISGLARDAVCARVFGTSAVWSAFVTAFIVPNLFRRLFGEGALSAAFIPRYTRLLDTDGAADAGDRFASLTVWLLSAGLAAVVVAAELILAACLLVGGEEDTASRQLIMLTMVMLPYTPLVCVTAILGGMLQVRGRFAPHAAAPVLLNVLMSAAAVGGAVLLPSIESTAYMVAGAVVLAGGLQVWWCLWRLRGLVRWHGLARDAWHEVRAMLSAMVPVIIGMGALQLSSLIDAAIAGFPLAIGPTIQFGGTVVDYPLDESAASVLYYAQRLYQFPLGVFGIAIATAVFPALARAGAPIAKFDSSVGDGRGAGDVFARTLREGIRLSFFIAWPATIGLFIVREPLTAVLYGGGGFASEDIRRVSGVLAGYALAVWAYALTHVLTRAFYALGDTGTPMRIGLISVAANVMLNLALIWPLREAGLAWSTALCACGQAIALFVLLKRRGRSSFSPVDGLLLDRASVRSLGMAGLAGVAMGVGLLVFDRVALVRWFPDIVNWGDAAMRLAALMTLGAAGYGACAAVARLPELGWVLRALGIGTRRSVHGSERM